jgi:hypothetical protein
MTIEDIGSATGYFPVRFARAVPNFIKGDLPIGPPDHMKLAPGEVITELSALNYRLVQNHTFLPYQYVLIFNRQNS